MEIAYSILHTSRFIDVHSLGAYSDEELKRFQESPMDEYGVKVLNIFYNREVGLTFCLLEAPNRQSVERHHESMGSYVIGLPKYRLLLEEVKLESHWIAETMSLIS